MDFIKDVEKLRRVPMFARLPKSKLKLLAFASESISFADGEIMFNEGDPADAAYVIMDGEADILSQTDTGPAVVGTLHSNELVGELGVLTQAPRAATIRAVGELRALRISDDLFIKLVGDNPEVALDVMRQLSAKLTLSHRKYEDAQRELEQVKGRQGNGAQGSGSQSSGGAATSAPG